MVCVDTWLGGTEPFMVRDNLNYFESLDLKNGYPQLYYRFLANVMHSGVHDIIVPLAQTSAKAARILSNFGQRPDIAYIDASHQYIDVWVDLMLYWDLLQDDGIMIGDDYNPIWNGVVQAVRRFSKEKGLKYRFSKEKSVFEKSGKHSLEGCAEEDGLYWNGNASEYCKLQ